MSFAAPFVFCGHAEAQAPYPLSLTQELQVLPLSKYIEERRFKFKDRLGTTQDHEFLASVAKAQPGERAEVVLRTNYSLRCTGNAHYVVGTALYQDRAIRVLLFEGTAVIETGIGPSPTEAETLRIEIQENTECKLENTEFSFDYSRGNTHPEVNQLDIGRLALLYSPFIIPSPTSQNFLPLLLAYHLKGSRDGKLTIVYTLCFSRPTATANQIKDRYSHEGIATELQIISEVTIDKMGRILGYSFRGLPPEAVKQRMAAPKGVIPFLVGTQHPLIVLNQSDTGLKAQLGAPEVARIDGFQLVPRTAVPDRFQRREDLQAHRISQNTLLAPLPREWLLFERPWIFRSTDLELRKQASPTAPPALSSPDYLYVIIYGRLTKGKVRAILEVGHPEDHYPTVSSAPSGDGISIIGSGMWGYQSVLAIPVGREILARLYEGRIPATLTLVPSEVGGLSVRELPRILMLQDRGRSYVSPLTVPSLELSSRVSRPEGAASDLIFTLSPLEEPIESIAK